MFHSDNIDYNPLESLFKRPSFSDQNPISKQDHDPSFFSNFPSPFFDEHELPLNQMLLPEVNNMLQPGSGNGNGNGNGNGDDDQFVADQNEKKSDSTKKGTAKRGTNGASKSKEKGPRKRTGKKDRHSKICTAQGIRDRRMRLSLQVARKFFDLQDMLGYDKASKTIEWLFGKSKKAIKELTKDNLQRNNNISISDAKSDSFISECTEGVSGIEEINSINEIKIEQQKPRCKTNVKESREKARERARWRTREKMMIKKLVSLNSTFEGVLDQENQERVSTFGGDFVNQLGHDVGTIEKLLGNSCSSSTSCPIPDNQLDPFLGFLGNWDLLDNDRLNTSHVAVTNQVSIAGNYPNSVYSTISTPSFPLFHQ